MTVGLRIKGPSGAVLMDTTTGMTRILGTLSVPANSPGSINVPGFATGTPFVVGYAPQAVSVDTSQYYPTHSISGTTLSWGTGPLSQMLVYGVYAGTSAGKVGSGQIGFRAVNGSFATQIDSFYANHALISTGTVNIPAGDNTQVITVTANMPILAYRGTNVIAVVRQQNLGSGQWAIEIGVGPYAAQGTYYIFDTVSAQSLMFPSNIGLRIRNKDTDALLFDSRTKYLRVNSVATNKASSDTSDTGSAPVTLITTQLPMDNLAVINDPGLWFYSYTRPFDDPDTGQPSQEELYAAYISGAGVNGTTLTEGSVSVGFESTTQPFQTSTARSILVDISNF